MKNVEIRSFFWSVFSCIRTKYGDLGSNFGQKVTPFQSSNDENLFLMSKYCLKMNDRFLHTLYLPQQILAGYKELMIKTSFLDDRHELPEIYLEPAEHLR